MEEELAWKWDPSPAHDYRNYIRIDSFQEILAFGGRNDQDTMVVVQGSKPLAQNMYHTWTVLIQNIWNAEVMIGIATEDADFTEKWNQKCRLGMDKESWALSCGGSMCHSSIAVIHEDFQFFPKDFVTVHLNLIKGTLMFAINNKIIGFQYSEIPRNTNIYPVVGVARRCELRLVSAYSSQPSLQLMALLVYMISKCKTRGLRQGCKVPKMPQGASMEWLGSVSLERSRLPPGMLKEYKSRYPWFTEEHYIKPRTRLANHQRRLRHKSLIPKVVRLADPFEAPRPITFVPALDRSPKRIIRSRKCHCGLSHSKRICCHERVLKFFRKREISYLSSSDDEVFPHISKKRKKCKKRSNT